MSEQHHCHWPGCDVVTPPKMFACKEHWYRLPKAIRDRIWNAYVPGQEIHKNPTGAYLDAAAEARAWARKHDVKARGQGEFQFGDTNQESVP